MLDLRHLSFAVLLHDAIPDAALRRLSWRAPRPATRVFMAALTSRSCSDPHSVHTHCLTDRPCQPVGPVKAPHTEHVLVELRDWTSMYCLPPERLL